MQETDRNSVTNSNRWLDLCREADRRFGRSLIQQQEEIAKCPK